MPRTDLLQQSATRAELDQRSREARLRLERIERLLAVRSVPRPSLLRRVLRRLGSRISTGQLVRSASATGRRARPDRRTRAGSRGAADSFPTIGRPLLYRHIPKCEYLCVSQGRRIGPPSRSVPSCAMLSGTNLGTKRDLSS